MIFTDEQGKRWKPIGYRPWLEGHWYISPGGRLTRASIDEEGIFLEIAPVPIEHTIGGIVFEETGETRPTKEGGEWVLDMGVPFFFKPFAVPYPYTILRPVRIVELRSAPE